MRGGRALVKYNNPNLDDHSRVEVKLEAMFFLPDEVSDAVFKIYYNKKSAPAY